MIKITGNGTSWEIIAHNNFPAGELLLKLPIQQNRKYSLLWAYDNEAELFAVYSICRHIINNSAKLGTLHMPYIPNARMDRTVLGEDVFTLKYFSEIINICKFENVQVLDAHSNVSCGLIDNVKNYDCTHIVENLIRELDPEKDFLFFPDNGAANKYSKIYKFPYLTGNKERDWKTGEIEGLEVIGSDNIIIGKSNILIIDDICSRGGTFMYSAQALKHAGANNISLFVSHCENTIWRGSLLQNPQINRIITTDSIFSGELHPKLEVNTIFRSTEEGK